MTMDNATANQVIAALRLRGITVRMLAKRLKRTEQHIYGVINGLYAPEMKLRILEIING